MKKVGLYFGSYNPIHMGHLIVAQFMQQFSGLDEVWLVVSPHNPSRKKADLLDDRARLYLVQLAIEGMPGLRVSDVEFGLPRPGYTVDTLACLEEQHPDRQFCLIMGSDNLAHLHKWKNAEYLLSHYRIYVYPRSTRESGLYSDHRNVVVVDAPLMELSGSFIRRAISEGKEVSAMVPPRSWEEICLMNYYK